MKYASLFALDRIVGPEEVQPLLDLSAILDSERCRPMVFRLLRKATGQTWAKKLLQMKIVGPDGEKPDFGKLLALRYLTTQAINLVPVVGPLYVLVDVLFIFGDERRCLHDRIAGTRVVVAD